MAKGRFAGIREAKVSKRGSYYKEGNHRVKITNIKMQTSQNAKGGEFYIIETICLATSHPEIEVGKEYSQLIKMNQAMTFPNIKRFIAAVSGCDPLGESVSDEIELLWQAWLGKELSLDDIVELSIAENDNVPSPLVGSELDLECQHTKTQADDDFTIHLWSHENVVSPIMGNMPA